ncbi:MAG: hypothetical protein AAF491_04655 [Verrucomicrobiota bacterium]
MKDQNDTVASSETAQATGQLAARVNGDNPNHHLWNNRGTWWCHYTIHRPDYTSERIRVSLKTRELERARQRRDEILKAFSS